MPFKPQTFRHRNARSHGDRQAEYDQRRGTARERGYGARWDKASLGFRRAHPLCLGCEAIGEIEPATVTDHVIPHRGDMVLFWDSSKWQPSCDWHHNEVKQRLEALFDQGKATEADLWLNSEKAKEISAELTPGGEV